MNIKIDCYITENNEWQAWIEFFLNAVDRQADKNIDKITKITELYEKLKKQFIEATHSQFAISVLDTFFKKPIVNSTHILKMSNIPNRITANALLKKLVEKGYIKVLKSGRGRNPSVYIMQSLLNILKS